MKAVIQRVSRAEVRVGGQKVAETGRGLLVLVAVEKGDGPEVVAKAAERFATLRVFEDENGKMNLSLGEVGGSVLLVSQFTLAGSIARGRRPSFDGAAPPEVARLLFESLATAIQAHGVPVSTGVFGAHMEVELVNDGPVTLIWESKPAAG
ncbi:MAG: D-aminoacyl-tRNA deacylase [Thermoanaerobaculum sp.]|nr:MAG: D-aminoacyl-tRNA deacylase [Thermoanaerobaculum sp.]